MPPMLETLGTPWITSTSPGCARLWASNSAIRLTWARAPASGSMRCRMLRTVSARPASVLPGMVGRSTEAPMTPHGMPSSSMVSEMIPVGSPSAMKRSTTPPGSRGTAISLMFSAAMRPVSLFFFCTFTESLPVLRSAAGVQFYIHRRRRKRSNTYAEGHCGWALAPAGAARYVAAFPHKKRPIPMIDFYTLTSPNAQKIYLMLEECGLPYKEHFVDVWKGDQYSPEFSKINPNNKIPAIVDHDG